MPRVRMSESELTELAGKVQKQKQNIDFGDQGQRHRRRPSRQ